MQATHKKLRKGAKCLPLDGYVCRCAVLVDSSHRRVRLRRAHASPSLTNAGTLWSQTEHIPSA